MSRFDYDGDEDFPGAWALWEKALTRAVSSAKGQQDLRDLEAALLALPEKRLILGALAKDGEVCAVGALVLHRRVQAGELREKVLADLADEIDEEEYWYGGGAVETMLVGMKVGLAKTLACEIGYVNDEDYHDATPEQRYERVLGWARKNQIERA